MTVIREHRSRCRSVEAAWGGSDTKTALVQTDKHVCLSVCFEWTSTWNKHSCFWKYLMYSWHQETNIWAWLLCTARAEVLYFKLIQKHQRCWSYDFQQPVVCIVIIKCLLAPRRQSSYSTWTLSYSLGVWSTGRLTSTKVFSLSINDTGDCVVQYKWTLSRDLFVFFGILWFQYMFWNCHKSTITVPYFPPTQVHLRPAGSVSWFVNG